MLTDGNKGLGSIIKSGKKSGRNPINDKIKSGIYKAITTGKPDPEGRGRLEAYVPRLGGTEETPMYFQYASPFGGSNGVSNYGFFAVPPDKGLTVMVFFAEGGDLTEGYWFSMLQQVPNVASGGASSTALKDGSGQGEGAYSDQPAQKSSSTNLQQNQNPQDGQFYDEFGDLIEDPDAKDPRGNQISPNHPRNTNLAAQGTYTDPVRGQTTSTPLRDASYEEPQPSKVFGMSTPGQNALTMDDGSVGDDETIHPSQIRLSTGSGASVIIDGTNDFIYLVNSSGSSWVELGADGNILVYGSGSISMRAEKDFNIHADQNVNIEAVERVNIKAGTHLTAEANRNATVITKGSQFFDSSGSTHIKVGSNMYASTGGLMHLNGPQAAAGQSIPTSSLPDIQNMESTTLNDSIASYAPSHEPYTRPSPAQTGGGSIVPDPNSYAGKSQALNTALSNSSAEYNDGTSVNGDVVATGSGEGGRVEYSPYIGTRRMPLDDELMNMIKSAAEETNFNIVITSGGQALKGSGGRRTGSTRHDLGFAADIQIYDGEQLLSVAKSNDLPKIITFCRTIKGKGVKCIGAGPGYMGSTAIHVDIAPGRNLTPANAGRFWGASHGHASAPSWLRQLMA